MPASRMKPGEMTETPTPVPSRSCRSPKAKPRTPNFVAAYSRLLLPHMPITKYIGISSNSQNM